MTRTDDRQIPVAQWLAGSVARAIGLSEAVQRSTGLMVVVNPILTHACTVNRDEGRIEMRASLGVDRFFQVLRQVERTLTLGQMTPEIYPVLLDPPPGGIVVPLRHRHESCRPRGYHTAS